MSHHLEDRLFAFLLFGDRTSVLESEVSMPRKARRIDGVIRLHEPGESWGRLRPLVADRIVAVEAYSRTPGVADVGTACTKLAWVNEKWLAGQDAHGSRPPCLVVFADGTPSKVLRTWRQIVPTELTAIRRAPDWLIGSVVLVDLRHLPRVDGTSVLRWLVPPRSADEVRDRIAHLREDRALSDTFRQRLLEAVMAKTFPTIEFEQGITYQGAVEKGRREGMRDGMREGMREARGELLVLARELCGGEAANSLAEIEDIAELRARITDLLRGQAPR